MKGIFVFALLPFVFAKPKPGLLWDTDCGRSIYEDAGGINNSRMIVGGTPAREYELPYQVSLINNAGDHFCGGVLIDNDVVLTAAHCTARESVDTMKVTISEHIRNEPNEFKKDVGVKAIIVHEEYVALTLENDISMLILEEEIEWNNGSQAACKPKHNPDDIAGESTTVSGWGTEESGGSDLPQQLMYVNDHLICCEVIPNKITPFLKFDVRIPGGSDLTQQLMYVNVPLMGREVCERCMPEREDIGAGMICAGNCGNNDGDACNGDSGGPLVWKNADNLFELYGLVSWGYGCADITPGIYTNVYFYLDWIEAHLPVP